MPFCKKTQNKNQVVKEHLHIDKIFFQVYKSEQVKARILKIKIKGKSFFFCENVPLGFGNLLMVNLRLQFISTKPNIVSENTN